VAATPNASTTCADGTVEATAGAARIGFGNSGWGATIAAGSTCTVSVDVTGDLPGAHWNGLFMYSAIGESGPAIDTLTVIGPAGFSKTFGPGTIDVGEASTLTFTIDNTANEVEATDIDFTDNLPAGVVVAGAPNASTTCTGGTLAAVGGAGSLSYTGGTVAAHASCTVSADVTSDTPGTYANTTGDLTSSVGNSGPASASLTVTAAPVPALGPVWLVVLAGLLGLVAYWQLRPR